MDLGLAAASASLHRARLQICGHRRALLPWERKCLQDHKGEKEWWDYGIIVVFPKSPPHPLSLPTLYLAADLPHRARSPDGEKSFGSRKLNMMSPIILHLLRVSLLNDGIDSDDTARRCAPLPALLNIQFIGASPDSLRTQGRGCPCE